MTDVTISLVTIHDGEGDCALEVVHTVHEEICIKRYGGRAIGLSYDEARALARALTFMMDQPGLQDAARKGGAA